VIRYVDEIGSRKRRKQLFDVFSCQRTWKVFPGLTSVTWTRCHIHSCRILLLIPTLIALQSCGGSSGSGPTLNQFAQVSASSQFSDLLFRSSPSKPIEWMPRIRHIVIIFQENRTPDNLFHDLPNADIADRGINSNGENIPLRTTALNSHFDLDHSHSAFVKMHSRGKMDGANKVHCSGNCPPNAQFTYVRPSQVKPYLDLAEQYTFADRMFQTHQGPSFPAHQFIIAGTLRRPQPATSMPPRMFGGMAGHRMELAFLTRVVMHQNGIRFL